jgi:hypothetical protein
VKGKHICKVTARGAQKLKLGVDYKRLKYKANEKGVRSEKQRSGSGKEKKQ